jgi:HSP20 family molecular chaperone IbpA
MLYQFQDRIDPYSEVDGAHIHSSVNSPRFNVSETETSYLLDGEFPGLADKRAISVEWTNNQVLIIRGTISPGVAENNLVYPSKNGLNNDGPPAAGICLPYV